MWLRVINCKHHSSEDYQLVLKHSGINSIAYSEARDALRLETPCDVSQLPGFDKG